MAERNAFEIGREQIISEVLSDPLHGKKIYLLGSAEFGPTNEPILVKSSVGLRNKFGKHGTLIDAWHKVKYASKNNQIYLVKTTGEHSTAYLNVNIFEGDIIEEGFILIASESNEIFDTTKIVVDTDGITIINPESLIDHELVYKYADYPTIDRLTDAINKDVRNRRSYIQAHYTVDPATPTEHAFYACNPTIMYMCGGMCGLEYSKNLLYNCLTRTYEILESHEIDIIVPVDAFLDDIYPDDSEGVQHQYGMKYYQTTKDYLMPTPHGIYRSFLNQCLDFCLIQNNFGIITTGILGFNPQHKVSSFFLGEADELNAYYESCIDWNVKHCGNPYYLFMCSAVAGDISYNMGTFIDNGYLAYAALCADTLFTTGTTNLPFSDTIMIYQEFTEPVLQGLAKSGICAFRHSPLYEQPVIYEGVTCYRQGEGFNLQVNVRIIQLCISYLNRLYQFYVGNNMHYIIDRQIINNDTKKILDILKNREVITDYDFVIQPNFRKGEVKVYLDLQTCWMVKAIKVCSVINLEFKEDIDGE